MDPKRCKAKRSPSPISSERYYFDSDYSLSLINRRTDYYSSVVTSAAADLPTTLTSVSTTASNTATTSPLVNRRPNSIVVVANANRATTNDDRRRLYEKSRRQISKTIRASSSSNRKRSVSSGRKKKWQRITIEANSNKKQKKKKKTEIEIVEKSWPIIKITTFGAGVAMKLRERILLGICLSFVLFTFLLVIDLQFDSKYRNPDFYIPSRHARLQFRPNAEDGERSVYKVFQETYKNVAGDQRQQLQQFGPIPLTEEDEQQQQQPNDQSGIQFHDPYDDLAKFIIRPESQTSSSGDYYSINNDTTGLGVIFYQYDDRDNEPTLEDTVYMESSSSETNLTLFQKRISKRQLYSSHDTVVDAVLNDMRENPIVHVRQKEGGTQLKLVIDYLNGDQALFKPMRFPREQQTLKNHFYFTDYERHNAEIAAFHLDRILGFRRAMPVTGRVLNLTTEFYEIADPDLLKTFFISPSNNLCFHGKCSYYCDTSHAICGNPDMLEGSFAAFLPDKEIVPRKASRHPWRRSYHKRRKAIWETDSNYCESVRSQSPYNTGTILVDIIDTCIFDFLIGNMDRHHIELFQPWGNRSFPIHLDQGRAFGRPFHDELSILAPLTQCCLVKNSTVATLLEFHNAPKKLSEVLRESLKTDPVAPVLWEPHLRAIDRRIGIVLEAVRSCLLKAVLKQNENVDTDKPSSSSVSVTASPLTS